jgi:hypothetical protein
VVQLHGHVAVESYNPKTKVWEFQDPFFDSAASFEGQPISAAAAHDLVMRDVPFQFAGPRDVFLTVGYVPRNNFAQDHLPTWHYFHYDHLDYWRITRVSERSSDLWKRLYSLAHRPD